MDASGLSPKSSSLTGEEAGVPTAASGSISLYTDGEAASHKPNATTAATTDDGEGAEGQGWPGDGGEGRPGETPVPHASVLGRYAPQVRPLCYLSIGWVLVEDQHDK